MSIVNEDAYTTWFHREGRKGGISPPLSLAEVTPKLKLSPS